MRVQFQADQTGKTCLVVVTSSELESRARELGYENICLLEEYRFSEAELNGISETGLCVALIRFDPEENEQHPNLLRQLRKKDVRCIGYNLGEHDENELKPTLDLALSTFPAKKRIERRLVACGYIMDQDYKDRCGHCSRLMAPEDRYCKYCGTERGRGEFQPFDNSAYGVYGPPVKKKYKCTECGNIWIVVTLGGDQSKYCPRCGKKAVKVQQRKYADFATAYDFLGSKDPYDADEHPELLTEEQIKNLLSLRNGKQKFRGKALFVMLRRAGINIRKVRQDEFNNLLDMRSDLEGEQLTVASMALSCRGDAPVLGAISCPICNSKYVVSFEYELIKGENRSHLGQYHMPTGEDNELVYNGGREFQLDYNAKYIYSTTAFCCLQCGTEFGKFEPQRNNGLFKK